MPESVQKVVGPSGGGSTGGQFIRLGTSGTVQVTGAGTTVATIGPLLPGDRIDAVQLSLGTGAAGNSLANFSASVIAAVGSAQPSSAAAAGAIPLRIINNATVPVICNAAIWDGAAVQASHVLKERLPVLFVADHTHKHVAVILTNNGSFTIEGSVWIDVFRPNP